MKNYLKLGGILFAITAVTALLLSGVNALTFEKIANLEAESVRSAQMEVLEGIDISGAESETFAATNPDTTVTEYTQFTLDDGKRVFCFTCRPVGYGGEISMVVGVNDSLEVTGIKVIGHSETPGLGARIETDPNFLPQFKGKTLTGDSVEMDAISGATISSRAVNKGISDCLAAARRIME